MALQLSAGPPSTLLMCAYGHGCPLLFLIYTAPCLSRPEVVEWHV